MRRVFVVLVLGFIVTLTAGGVSPALADVAPPQNPPGASIKSSAANTKVQMVSEDVLMTIDSYQPTEEQMQSFLRPFMRGHVDATFIMQNQGDAAEAFDVWFPLGVPNGFTGVTTVDNFKAWVDGVEAASIGQAETVGQWDTTVPWATWPVTFPPGQQVTLRVTYDTFPTGHSPYAEFGYVLETGAGWFGPIGDGTITYRFPYEVNELNAVTSISKDDPYSARGGPITVSGTDVIWRFADLEPNEGSNIALTALSPSVWRSILAAETDAKASPDSAQAQLALAEAYHRGLPFKYGLIDIGGSYTLRDRTTEAYEAALKLDPNDVDIYVGYLSLLESLAGPIDLPDPLYVSLLDRGLKLAPDNERLLEMKQRLDGQLTYAAEQGTFMPPTSVPAETSAPLPTETGAPVTVVTPTPIPTQPDIPTPTPAPTAAPGGGGSPIVVLIAAVGFLIAMGLVGGSILLARWMKK